MPLFTRLTLTFCFLFLCFCARTAIEERDNNWPEWRGPLANGIVQHGDPPQTWDDSSNVRWKIDLPGKGHSTPIVWGNQVFILTAVETGDSISQAPGEPPASGEPRRRRRGIAPARVVQFTVLSIDRRDGNILWRQVAREQQPHQGTHQTATWASSSPITDGEHLYAFFGSQGLYCYDLQGNLKWERDFGDMDTRRGFGEGISPALHGDRLVINWDHEGQSFIVVVNKKTGEDIWKKERDEPTSWSTPYILEYGGKTQVIVNGANRVRAYDLENGDTIWQCGGMTLNAIPMPVAADNMVYLMSGFRGNALHAIDLSQAQGDITDSAAVVWQLDQDTPYTPSPLLADGRLYFLKRNDAILSCFNAKTGENIYGPQRLEGMRRIYASPVIANDRIYIFDRNGTGMVIEHGDEFKVIATNSLDDGFSASPAIVGSQMFLRGHDYLYCIEAAPLSAK